MWNYVQSKLDELDQYPKREQLKYTKEIITNAVEKVGCDFNITVTHRLCIRKII